MPDLSSNSDGRSTDSGVPPRLSVAYLSKTFAGQVALSNFDLDVQPGEIHALVGENGSGKSTFIKILAGFYAPDPGGEISIDGEKLRLHSAHASYHAGLRFVHQDLALIDSVSVLDNLSFGNGFSCVAGSIRWRAERRRASADLARLGIQVDPRTPVRQLTAAVRTGVAVARALRQQPGMGSARLLVLDEPTATLPANEVARLLEIIRSVASSGVGVLYVSHRLDEIFEIADNVTVLRDGKKAAQRPVKSLNRRELVSLMVGTEFDDVHEEVAALPERREETLLQVDRIVAPTLNSVSFSVAGGEIVGIAGITGSGREMLLATIFGSVRADSGTVRVAEKIVPGGRPSASIAAGMALLPADRKNLGGMMELSARENMTVPLLKPFWKHGVIARRAEKNEVSQWFGRLDVRPRDGVDRPLATFSGGNQQKLLFAKWLRTEPAVLFLDEPTQGVDVGAKAQLHSQILAIAARGAAVVVASSDADELAALCQRVLVMRNGQIITELSGEDVTVANLARDSLGSERGKASAR